MADSGTAADGYETWLAEKLWELIPAYHRHRDGEDEPPGTLRALVEVVAKQGALLRRSQDRVWDDMFIELCDAWAIPYIGDLVASRLPPEQLDRARRADVAKTVYYRRRAGTPRVLEELIADMTGWEGVVREQFRRLGRSPHGLDPVLTGRGGPLTGTPPGGLADLRNPGGAELADGPFDELHHTPDLRRHRGHAGRHGIPKLGVHVYRLGAWRLTGVSPRRFVTGTGTFYTFDPLGRDVPLFARRSRGEGYDYDDWRSAREWELPVPVRCRLLGHTLWELTTESIAAVEAGMAAAGTPASTDETTVLQRLVGTRYTSQSRLLATLTAWTETVGPACQTAVLRYTLSESCGKHALLSADTPSLALSTASPPAQLGADAIVAGGVDGGATTIPAGFTARVEPERGRFVYTSSPSTLLVDLHLGSTGPVGAGPWDRDEIAWVDPDEPLPGTLSSTVTGGGALSAAMYGAGTDNYIKIDDNRTYGPPANFSSIVRWGIVAGDQTRPLLRLTSSNWQLRTSASTTNGRLVLDGLWIANAGSAPRYLDIFGSWELVEIRSCTFDPGGVDAAGGTLHPIAIRVRGFVERLVIQSSVLTRVFLQASGTAGDPAAVVESVEIYDSILQPPLVSGGTTTENALALGTAEVRMERCTVLGQAWMVDTNGDGVPDSPRWAPGELSVNRLYASDCLFTGAINVIDRQNGCFRFSAAQTGALGHVPDPFESAFFSSAESLFVSSTFGEPGYGQLSDAPEQVSPDDGDLDAHASILSGAENDGEMGAFNSELSPLKERALLAKLEEFMPFGLVPLLIHET